MYTFWRDHPWRLRSAVLLVVALLVGGLQAIAPQAFDALEQTIGDWTWRIGSTARPERRMVVVDIDEASLKQVGPWPWSRGTLAKLSEKLQQAGVVVQVYDINFPDPREGDGALAEAWKAAPVVAGQIFSLDPAVTPRVGTVAGALAAGGCPPFAPRSHGFYGHPAELLQSGATIGHITPRTERDGVVRKVPALICHEGRAYPSLALAALWRATQAEGATSAGPDWVWSDAQATGFGGGPLAPFAWLTSPSLPGLAVPVDEHGDLRVPYRLERRAFVSVSAHDVLNGTVDPALLKDTIALVGATAFGIGDTIATPHATVAAGLEVHAQALIGLLDHRLPYTPARAGWIHGLAVITIAGLLLLVLRRRAIPAKRLPIAGALLAVACYGASATLLLQADLWLPWTNAALFALLASVALATAEHALTRAQRERLSAHLGAYLPAPVARRLMATDPSGRVQVDQREVSVLVADIRNFSSFAAHRPAEETAAMLHAFCCIAVDVVEQHGGVVENVVGDSVLAVWNAYSDCADHPQQALLAAQELLRATRTLLAPTQPTHEDSPVQPLALGVGIESGRALVGSFGPARRRAHAALGEPVSVASRLQQMTLDLSMPILMGPQLAAQLPQDSTESLGDYLLEGLSRQYTLHAPKAWAELVPTEPLWVKSATADAHGGDSGKWSGWADSGASAPMRVHAAIQLRDA
ncbi:CHASE2 domain-containing protein [Aquabacterium humicola]|uniref:CHASE2 domain-containing protein n=1 Tax=Aquabacterium humicola TaxID=3237377 RepID=UPI002543D815|nr:adenylate/guanylate cyclase domain-containing protein [Rubrivivax pictus]